MADDVDWGFIQKMAERYPGFMWVGAYPELRDVIVRATKEEWAPDLFEAQLRSTNWWKTTEPKIRDWIQLEGTDPAAAGARIAGTKQTISGLAAQLGTTLDEAKATELATNFHKLGWTDQTLRQQIANAANPGTGALIDVKALADRYMVDVSDTQAAEWTRRLFSGELTEEGLTSVLGQQATASFPYLKEHLEKGVLPGDYFASYKTMISRLTDTDEKQVDLLRDPTWRQIVSHAADGQIRAMTLNEAEHHVRGTNQFKNSRTGQQQLAQFRAGFEQQLGLRA